MLIHLKEIILSIVFRTGRSKYFRGRRIHGDWDVRVEQAEFREISITANSESGVLVSMAVIRNGTKVVRYSALSSAFLFYTWIFFFRKEFQKCRKWKQINSVVWTWQIIPAGFRPCPAERARCLRGLQVYHPGPDVRQCAHHQQSWSRLSFPGEFICIITFLLSTGL